jgi:DNA (cytosine-5)-methyltransferase 1
MKVLDLFSGIGGFSLGLERAGMKTVAFCEFDQACHKVLQKHWPKTPIYNDVRTLNGTNLQGTIDVICGGFPCQDISLVGKGGGLHGKRSGLWWEFHRLIKEIKPSYVIAENVTALRSRGLDEVLRSLVEIGYDAEWHCISASAIGAPHRRDRVWIIGYPNNQSGLETTQTIMPNRESWQTWKNNCGGYWGSLSRTRRPIPQSISIGVDNGISNRVDRHKQLGNAVVPQISELIGRAIMERV